MQYTHITYGRLLDRYFELEFRNSVDNRGRRASTISIYLLRFTVCHDWELEWKYVYRNMLLCI